ncbi:hypothetical protein E0H26_13010 [Micromonospora zingiberis]|uniref:Uncharacterized protein n=1 Tax=Micromonospora zingiberis TaxID=2053011 RepID=A0A4R0GNH8_9ACTN|nr:hypothetical protein [Micromonospora zingiberis]TCB97189.1 hypothetical protein E0H26_13010 [Micromonospora zingiberis]
MIRGVAVAALAVVVTLPGAATPARAAGVDAIKKVGEVAFGLLLQSRQGELTEQQIIQALQQFVGVVRDAESEIISHLDAVAAAPWVGAAQHAILEVPSLPLLAEDPLQDYALQVALHARQAKSVFDAVEFGPEADHLGFAVASLYAVGLQARIAAGLGTTTYLPNYRTAMEAIVNRLEPQCSSREGDMDYHPSIYHVVHTCRTPYGDRTFQDYQVNGHWQEGPWTEATLKAAAGAATSWVVAKDVLQRMNNGGI